MNRTHFPAALAAILLFSGLGADIPARGIEVDLSGYNSNCGVNVVQAGQRLTMQWPMEGEETGQLVVNLLPGQPLFQSMDVAPRPGAAFRTVLQNVDPLTFVVVGERRAPEGRPPQMSVFNVFFDSPATRPHQAFRSRFEPGKVRAFSHGRRATVAIGGLKAGPFAGEWEVTVYSGARLVHLEAVVSTQEERRAFLYDLALMGESMPVKSLSWVDTEGVTRQAEPDPKSGDHPIAVRHRAIAAASSGGSIACFPPPHRYFFPRDLTDNQQTVWYGRDHRGLDARFGFGIRQTERGGGAYVPWFNDPPGTAQRLGAFFLLTSGTPRDALKETLKFTHGDRFPRLDHYGYHTLTSHFHMAIAMAALEEKARGKARTTPDFVRMFKEMGVEMVHLAEFHGDGHPDDPGPRRLPELQSMFDECRRLSDKDLLLIPGEEANAYLGLPAPGRHAGHWLYLFPREVSWTMKRGDGLPFREENPKLGPIYHVGSRADMLKLLEVEDGLAWTAHARIKASSWTPDIFRHEDFFLSDHWLGAAWKAMPADLSDDRLGRRVLDLMDDMANWGQRKYVLGEVDVFKLDHTHELYGHMNINYLRLDRVPEYKEGWKSVLDALKNGRFFVSTGEVLIPEFSVNPQVDGVRAQQSDGGGSAVIKASLLWTFPLQFAEVVSGDGAKVYRHRIDLSDSKAFGSMTLKALLKLDGRAWVRLEVWDVAGNGAFTQPIWLGPLDPGKAGQ